MSCSARLLVFTDLDGSLLDHHNYGFEAAVPVLDSLEQSKIPVIPVTSKTRAEIEHVRLRLGNRHPFIAENGAAIFIPRGYFPTVPAGAGESGDYWVLAFSEPREKWLEILRSLEGEFAGEFACFHQAGTAGIVQMTGLSAEEAALANQRDFSEPVQWLGSEQRKQEFVSAVRQAGANPLQGGRFLTLAGDCDKGRALSHLRRLFAGLLPEGQISDLAIGDSNNDIAMLEAAETALVVKSPVRGYPVLAREGGTLYSTGFGPEGWAEGVSRWLQQQAACGH